MQTTDFPIGPTGCVGRGFGNFQEVFVIRGFPVFSDDMTYNGICGTRVNLAGRDGETSADDQDREQTIFGLSCNYSGERLRLSAKLVHQDQHTNAPRPSVTPIGGIPAAPYSSTKRR